MIDISSREARRHFSDLLSQAERGEHISITRRGREVARLVPPSDMDKPLFPDLTAFRATMNVSGMPASASVVAARDDERY